MDSLTTPPGKSEFEAYRAPDANPPALVVQVGSTELRYHLRCIDTSTRCSRSGATGSRWASRTSRRPADDGTVEAWGRDPANPVGGWYGFKKGLRGRIRQLRPPVLEALGLAEVEHNARNNRMRPADDHGASLSGATSGRHPNACGAS